LDEENTLMAFQHHRWEKNGRLRVNDANPSQFQWSTTTADDENVDLGNGTFAPYTWDGSVAKFGRSELDMSVGGLFKFLGITRANRMDYTLEGDFGSGFVDANMGGVPSLVATENDDHLLLDLTFDGCEFRWQDVPGRTAQDGNMPVAFRTQIRLESGNRVTLSQYITSPLAHDIRIRLSLSGLDPYSPTQDRRDIVRRKKASQADDGTFVNFTGGVEIGNIVLDWHQDEADFRTINVTRQGQKRTLEILMGTYTLVADQELVIFPDTYGPTEITTASDDGYEGDSNWDDNYDGDGWRVGDGTYDGGLRFTGLPSNIGDISTVDTGTHVQFYVTWTGGDCSWNWRFVEQDNPSTFDSSSNYPSNMAQTTAAVQEDFTQGDEPVSRQGQELGGTSSPGQEWADTVTPVSGGAVSIIAKGSDFATLRIQVEDSESLSGAQHACKLTLVYTTGGAGGLGPIASYHYNHNVGSHL
jgi:hypothetical protein